MDRYATLFHNLEKKHEGAFIPFVTIGDPNKDLSFDIIDTLIKSGADALELGIPFSDPLADGPTIQEANIRALQSGVTTKDCFEIIIKIRQKYSNIPIGLLLYANLVYANGIENFYKKCLEAGIDSILIADVPIHESKEFCNVAKKTGISQIFIAPPDANEEVLKQISNFGSGYTYLLSRFGVTGTETAANMPVKYVINKLKEYNAPQPILGFGISNPNQVQLAIQNGVAGVISGSAIVKIIQNNLYNTTKMLTEIEKFVKEMKSATKIKN
ncbi:MAG: tryptophan synthase subunit alpha [Francisella sp.]